MDPQLQNETQVRKKSLLAFCGEHIAVSLWQGQVTRARARILDVEHLRHGEKAKVPTSAAVFTEDMNNA